MSTLIVYEHFKTAIKVSMRHGKVAGRTPRPAFTVYLPRKRLKRHPYWSPCYHTSSIKTFTNNSTQQQIAGTYEKQQLYR